MQALVKTFVMIKEATFLINDVSAFVSFRVLMWPGKESFLLRYFKIDKEDTILIVPSRKNTHWTTKTKREVSKRYINVLKLKKKLRDKINGTCKEASAKAQHLNADFQGCQTKSLFVLLCQASILLPTFFSIQCFGDGFFLLQPCAAVESASFICCCETFCGNL